MTYELLDQFAAEDDDGVRYLINAYGQRIRYQTLKDGWKETDRPKSWTLEGGRGVMPVKGERGVFVIVDSGLRLRRL